MLKNWDWILFDADDTLFHFDAQAGLQLLFQQYDVVFSHEDYLEYQSVNKPSWVEYQNGTINAQQLQTQRFVGWADKLHVTPEVLNTGYLTAMSDVCVPLAGAVNLLNALQGKVKMGIITNGCVALQDARLRRHDFLQYFDLLVISEQVGYAKPHPAIFDHALAKMGNPSRKRVLMVGDNPDSDILGGQRSGMTTCWLNVEQHPVPPNIQPDLQVRSLSELQEILIS